VSTTRITSDIDDAVAVLAAGGIVGIPTETVYGLAADARDEEAVAGIFRAKGRPSSNPIIVHVADVAMARALAGSWPASADAVATRLWPGPVTVVVPRGPSIPEIVTAGGDTVALRCPAHPLARRLIAESGIPLAAPSANRSEAVSPTTAHHVLEGLGNRIDLILDGGPCGRGIESTVVDCTRNPPRILRPGPVGSAPLAAATGGGIDAGPQGPHRDDVPRSPGLEARHYRPQTPLEVAADGAARVTEIVGSGGRVAWLTRAPDDARVRALAADRGVLVVPMPAGPAEFATSLYAALHAVDRRGFDRVIVDALPDDDAWRAVADRLARAATRS